MPERQPETNLRFVRTAEAARLLSLSARTLEKYRGHGCGPAFRKLGGRVVYAIEDLEAWANHATCRSTSDPRYVEMRVTGRLQATAERADATTLARR